MDDEESQGGSNEDEDSNEEDEEDEDEDDEDEEVDDDDEGKKCYIRHLFFAVYTPYKGGGASFSRH